MCFFDTKMDFLLKKWVSKPKWVKNEKKSIFDSNFGFFHSFWGSTPKMGQKWPTDPHFGGSAKNHYQIQWGAKKDYQIQWGARNHFFGGSKNRQKIIIKFNGFFDQKSENGGFPSDKMTKNGQKMAIFLKKSNREIQGFFF